MRLITCHFPEAYLDGIDLLVAKDAYPNRSEAIRMAVRDLLKAELGNFIQIQKPAKPQLKEEA